MLPGLWRLFSVRFLWHCCLPVRQETLRPVFKSSKCIFNPSHVLALPCSWMHCFMCARSVSAILLRDWWYQINNSIQSAKLSPAKCESHGGDNPALYQWITRARAHARTHERGACTCTRTRHTHEVFAHFIVLPWTVFVRLYKAWFILTCWAFQHVPCALTLPVFGGRVFVVTHRVLCVHCHAFVRLCSNKKQQQTTTWTWTLL